MKRYSALFAVVLSFAVGFGFAVAGTGTASASECPACRWYECDGSTYCCPDPGQSCSLMDYYELAPVANLAVCGPGMAVCSRVFCGCISVSQCEY